MFRPKLFIYVLCCLAFVLNAGVWYSARDVKAQWLNVPPVPSEMGKQFLGLGDDQFAYRASGIILQNLGSVGGRNVPLSDYNFDRLGEWFHFTDELDSQSSFVPLLAAFYFGATNDPDDLDPVIDYLAKVGSRPGDERWRWLGQAIYLSRFIQNDQDKALNLAYVLAGMNEEGMPGWTKQMPAFVMLDSGSKEAAYEILINLLKDEAENLHPSEVNFTRFYICDKILDKAESVSHPLCTDPY